ncbi:hypothetical protein MCUN1_002631 [Malassezia cuniculi]|uniref:Uncharacterized protein n=1 Tax=Malassezia cuniculi TaxID=948313 RepID=A0AAF0EV86_9BASI|nr:hypothetical protein MCUN1_002631 [Malassezia cuniculi]
MLPKVNHPILRAFFENIPNWPRVRVIKSKFRPRCSPACSTNTRSRSSAFANSDEFRFSTDAMRKSSFESASCSVWSDCNVPSAEEVPLFVLSRVDECDDSSAREDPETSLESSFTAASTASEPGLKRSASSSSARRSVSLPTVYSSWRNSVCSVELPSLLPVL